MALRPVRRTFADRPPSRRRAVAIAGQWYSVLTWSDPGVCLYALASTGRIRSEEHRARCLAYLREHIPARAVRCAGGMPAGTDLGAADAWHLRRLARYVEAAPLEPDPAPATH